MNHEDLVETFFSHYFEDVWNEKILDDKHFVVPTDRILNYILDVISVPYCEYLYYLIDWKLPELTKSDITQCSSFAACEIEMCENLLAENNPGFEFVDIGMLFPNYSKANTENALKKYGENQIKTSRQLGLAYEYYGLWYLDCLGYAYPSLNIEQRQSLLARTILRDPLYGRMVRDLLLGDISLSSYLEGLKDSTILRRGPSIIKILDIALNEAKREGIDLGKCDFIKPKIAIHSQSDSSASDVKLFVKKIDKSFLTHGMTIPTKVVNNIESILGIHLEKGETADVEMEFNGLCYQGRIVHVNLSTSRSNCYQILWRGRPSLKEALNLFYAEDSNNINNFQYDAKAIEVFISAQSKSIILKPKRKDLELDLDL